MTGHNLITNILVCLYANTDLYCIVCHSWKCLWFCSCGYGRRFRRWPCFIWQWEKVFQNLKNGKEDDVDRKPLKDPHHGLINVPLNPSQINTCPNSGRAYEEVAPFSISTNDLINLLPPSLFYGSAWFLCHPLTSAGRSLQMSCSLLVLDASNKLRILTQVGTGDIGFYYLKEPVSAIGEGSSVFSWMLG